MPLLSFNHRVWGHDFLPLSRGGSIAFAPLPTTDLIKTEYRWIQHLMSSLVSSEDCCDQQQSQGRAFVLFYEAFLLLLHLWVWVDRSTTGLTIKKSALQPPVFCCYYFYMRELRPIFDLKVEKSILPHIPCLSDHITLPLSASMKVVLFLS